MKTNKNIVQDVLFFGCMGAILFVAIIDLFHLLAFKGMNLFPFASTNAASQLWLVARFLQTIAILFWSLSLQKKIARAIIGHNGTFT